MWGYIDNFKDKEIIKGEVIILKGNILILYTIISSYLRRYFYQKSKQPFLGYVFTKLNNNNNFHL